MRLVAASLVDVALFAVAAMLGFLFALWAAPCPDRSDCAVLTPLILVCVVVADLLYAAVCYALWRTTLGRKSLGEPDR
jgi:hypothetical protein